MGRWTQYDEDDYRLPEGFKLSGYDADTQTWFFRDEKGDVWSSKERYGVMRPVKPRRRVRTTHAESSSTASASVEKTRKSAGGEEATESDDEKTLLDEDLDDEELEYDDDNESVAETLQAEPPQPRSLWTLFDDGNLDAAHDDDHEQGSRTPRDLDTQSNAGFASFIDPTHISPAEPLSSSSSSSSPSAMVNRKFRNIARLIHSGSVFGSAVADKVKAKAQAPAAAASSVLPEGVVHPDGNGYAYEGSEGKSLKDVDEEWEVVKRSATMVRGSGRAGGVKQSNSSASKEEASGKSRRAFSLREPRRDEGERGRGEAGGHGKQRSEGGPSSSLSSSSSPMKRQSGSPMSEVSRGGPVPLPRAESARTGTGEIPTLTPSPSHSGSGQQSSTRSPSTSKVASKHPDRSSTLSATTQAAAPAPGSAPDTTSTQKPVTGSKLEKPLPSSPGPGPTSTPPHSTKSPSNDVKSIHSSSSTKLRKEKGKGREQDLASSLPAAPTHAVGSTHSRESAKRDKALVPIL